MNDRVNITPEQGQIARLAEIQVLQFIRDALRAGQRAILVTERGPVSIRAPDAALTGFAGQTLHIGPPLPEPCELQRMIGAAVGIAGGGEMAPLAFAARLLFAAPGTSVILAIDDAHLLSHRSLAYLTEITELLAPDAPILQVVLAARPAFLATLAQPEFESFRNRLFRPAFETFQILPEAEDDEGASESGGLGRERATERPTPSPDDKPIAASKLYAIGRLAAQAAAGLTAVGCLAAIGYVALPAVSDGLFRRTIPPSTAASPQALMAPADRSQSPARLLQKQAGGVADQLIDALADAVANGPAESVAVLIERIADLEASASPDGLRLVAAMPDRFAARAIAAAAAGRLDEARRLEQVLLLTYPARVRPDLLVASNPKSFPAPPASTPGGGDARAPGGPAGRPEIPQSFAAPLAESIDKAGVDDRGTASPHAAAPSAPSAAPDRMGAAPAIVAQAAPMAPEAAPRPLEEQPGSADPKNCAAVSSSAAAPTPPGPGPDRTGEAAPPAVAPPAAPTEPAGPTPPSAARPDPADNQDFAAVSSNAGAPPSQDAAPPASMAPAAPMVATAPSTEPPGAPDPGHRAPAHPDAPALSPTAEPERNVDALPPAIVARAASAEPERIAAQLTNLPTLAPVRVVLDVARNDFGPGRAADIRQALVAAGLEVAKLVPVEERGSQLGSGPSIGYYFLSDRKAAAGVSHLLEPLLGTVNPVALRMRGDVPEPGTIEIKVR
jgi:hypothetical protein